MRLVFADGLMLADDSEQAVAPCATDATVVMPATVELCDHSGELVATHAAFPSPRGRNR